MPDLWGPIQWTLVHDSPALMFAFILSSAAIFFYWARRGFVRTATQYLPVPSRSGLSGADVAKALLEFAGVRHVGVVPGQRFWGNNHYHPLNREIVLSH